MAKKQPSDTVAKRLSHYLADTALLYMKTLNYHWNMVGPEFFMYHKLLEGQYEELSEALDEIAERIRMLGPKAPATMKEYLELASLKEGKSTHTQDQMVHELIKDHESMVWSATQLISFSDEQEDAGTSDLIVKWLRFHDKNAWLLRSHAKK